MKLKIAWYEENNYHTEIIGTFLEPFLSDTIVIFNDGDKSGYIGWFKKHIDFEIRGTNDFITTYKDFDIIIVGTSTSFKFYEQIKQEKLNDVTSKIFFVNHLKEDVIHNKNLNGIVLTSINKLFNQIYILPVNNFYKQVEKKNISEKPITICLIGRFKDSNRDVNDLIKLINNYNNLNFQIIIYTRHQKFIPDELLKIQKNFKNKLIIHYKASTETIIKSLGDIMYFSPLSSKDSCYTKDRLTGMIPLSYNFNTPLLLDEQTNSHYNLISPITYKNSICEIIEKICRLGQDDYKQLVIKTVEEKEQICKLNLDIMKNIFLLD